MKTSISDAALCRRRRWGVGTHLVGDEGYGPEEIVITAIGERLVLAQRIADFNHEELWTFQFRDWKKKKAEKGS